MTSKISANTNVDWFNTFILAHNKNICFLLLFRIPLRSFSYSFALWFNLINHKYNLIAFQFLLFLNFDIFASRRFPHRHFVFRQSTLPTFCTVGIILGRRFTHSMFVFADILLSAFCFSIRDAGSCVFFNPWVTHNWISLYMGGCELGLKRNFDPWVVGLGRKGPKPTHWVLSFFHIEFPTIFWQKWKFMSVCVRIIHNIKEYSME